jgi:hypothetical protein
MIENYLRKNYAIKNNKIVTKRFVEETDFISLVYNVGKIFSISEADSFNHVFNFTKTYGYNLKGEYGCFDDSFIKIDEFNLTTKVEEVDMFGGSVRMMGRTITEIDFKITHEHSKNILMDKCNQAYKSYTALAPIRFSMFYKEFYYTGLIINSSSYSEAAVHINANVGTFTPLVFKDELKSV